MASFDRRREKCRTVRILRRALASATALASIALVLVRPDVVRAQATCASTTTIACGEVKTGTIAALGETDCFQFTGEAGEVVDLLSKAVGSSIQACAQLRDPDGNVVGADACEQPASLTLPASGTYTIRLFDRTNDETGGYAVQLQVVSATASSCPAATLPCGANQEGTLAAIVQSDTYRFVAAAAGEVVSITTADVATPFEACWQLYAADGSALGTPSCAEATRTLPAAGPYTIRVFDLANDQTGTYRLDVNVVSATTTSCRDATLVDGAPLSGSIVALADNDIFWLTTSFPDQHIDIDTTTTSGSMNACWQLYDAGGAAIGGIACGTAERILASPGTYVLRVFDLTYDGAGTYDVARQTTSETPTPTITPTPTVTPTTLDGATPTGSAATATPAAGPSGGGTATPGGATPGAATATPSPLATGSTGLGTPTPQGTPTVQELESTLDDFLCYAAKLTRGTPRFTPALGLRLSDTLDATVIDVRKPTELCAPADKDGNGIGDPATSLQRYRIQRERHTPKFVKSTHHVVTSLGRLSLDVLRPDQLLVPTSESAVAAPAAPDPADHHVDRYKCYQVRVTRKTPKPPFDLQVTVTDLLSPPGRRFKVKSPNRLCVATGEDLAHVENPAGHLLCYPAKLIRGEPKHPKQRGLYLGNALGATRVDTLRESELCLPALLVP